MVSFGSVSSDGQNRFPTGRRLDAHRTTSMSPVPCLQRCAVTKPIPLDVSTLYPPCRRSRVNARVQRWGNSLAIRIPRTYASDLGVREGSEVELTLDGRALIVTPSTVPTLDALLDGITDANRHEELDIGPPEGREAW